MRIRTSHRGMSFRFIFFLWRHHQDFRVGGWGMRIRSWHWSMLFKFILFLWRHHSDFIVGGVA